MPTDPDRAKTVFQSISASSDGAKRKELLERECGADAELRLQVESMLRELDNLSSTQAPDASVVEFGSLGSTPPASTEPQPRFPPGSKLGKYDIQNFLARGGMGEVYRGFDPLVERLVALKVLPAGLATNSDAMQRFLAEARAVGKLQHSHAVTLFEIGQHEDTLFLAMEFVTGGAVADLLEKEGKLDWKRATRFMREVCDGLAAAHAVGIIHRDIKPESLLRTPDDQVKITDFGLAKALGAMEGINLTRPGSVLGTPIYMSPEQCTGDGVDHHTDIYSAGGTYYHLLTGQRPFASATNLMQLMFAHTTGPIPNPREVVPDLPADCCAIVAKAMAKRPADRFGTAAEMGAALERLLSDKPARAELEFWLIEPSRLQARIMQTMLSELGVAKTRVFANIADTLAAASQQLPAVILSAQHLVDGTGDDLAAKIAALPGGGAVFSFLISSDAALANPASYRPGKPLVLAKPVTKDILAHVVERANAFRG